MSSQRPNDLPYPLPLLLAEGIDIIPCQANHKLPLYPAWQTRPAAEQLAQALADGHRFNVAARAGGAAGLVIIDCETVETTNHIADWLSLNGVEAYPVIRSASGAGSHLWLKCYDIPATMTAFGRIASHFGQGEVRAGAGSYALIPPSYAWSDRIQGFGTYTFQKPPELFAEVNPVAWSVIEALLASPPRSRQYKDKLPELPLPLPYQPAPPLVERHLLTLDRLAKTQPSKHPTNARDPYATRSELEQSIIMILILCGWPYPEVQRFFNDRQPSHYRTQRFPESYLRLSYTNAVIEIIDTPIRQQILELYNWSHSTAWPLRTGLARQVFQIILITAWKDARFDPVVTYPSIQRATTASYGGISSALDYLGKNGFIRRNVQQIDEVGLSRIEILTDCQKSKQSHIGGAEQQKQSSFLQRFSYKLLRLLNRAGYCAPYVYLLFTDKPLKLSELIEQTRLSRNTVVGILAELKLMGLVCCEASGWRRVRKCNEVSQLPRSEILPRHETLQELVKGDQQVVTREVLPKVAVRVMDVVQSLEVEDPVKTYIRVMREIYHVELSEDRFSSRRRSQLKELGETLYLLHQSDQLVTSSPLSYMRWAGRVCLELAQRRGWHVLWIDVLASRRLLQSYVEYNLRETRSVWRRIVPQFD